MPSLQHLMLSILLPILFVDCWIDWSVLKFMWNSFLILFKQTTNSSLKCFNWSLLVATLFWQLKSIDVFYLGYLKRTVLCWVLILSIVGSTIPSTGRILCAACNIPLLFHNTLMVLTDSSIELNWTPYGHVINHSEIICLSSYANSLQSASFAQVSQEHLNAVK